MSDLAAAPALPPRKCANCGVPERRWKDDRGHPQVNLNPLSGTCVDCLGAEARERNQFHSRRVHQAGRLFDARELAAGKDGE